MRDFRSTMTPPWLTLALALTAITPAAQAAGTPPPHWDKCAEAATITVDPSQDSPVTTNAVRRRTRMSDGIRLSTLKRLAPAVLVTGQTYDFTAVCPFDEAEMERMAASQVQVNFYQEAESAAEPKGNIVLLPFNGPQRAIIVGTAMKSRKGHFKPVKFQETALDGEHEKKIVAAVSINGEKALVTFVLISASFYHRELQALHGRRP